MPTYVLMTKLSTQVEADPRGRKIVGNEWKKLVDRACPGVTWIAHYALLGRFDFMDIYDAPDDATAHQVSLLSREAGAITAESWPALPYDQYLTLAGEVEKVVKGGGKKNKKKR
ncbi:MAG TPA: GYD domain-containing protein [Polyangia bacterium]|jgi:uncharacterized protein with GYD domain